MGFKLSRGDVGIASVVRWNLRAVIFGVAREEVQVARVVHCTLWDSTILFTCPIVVCTVRSTKISDRHLFWGQ